MDIKYGSAIEASKNSRVEYTFTNKKQHDLYTKLHNSSLDNYYFTLITTVELLVGLGILTVGYPLSYYYCNDTKLVNTIFKYLLVIWLLWLLYVVYKRYRLNNIVNQVSDRVDSEIEHTETKLE
jgi:hypothetical protein